MLFCPRLKRSEPLERDNGTPMACSTCDGSIEPVVQAELPAVKAVAKEVKTEPKPESVEPTTLGQTRTIWWTLAVIGAVTLAGGGLLLLRRAGN